MIFTESRVFSRRPEEYLDDEGLRALQNALIENPFAGVEIRDTGGLRKLRWGIPGHGKRGGIRIIYAPILSVPIIHLVMMYQSSPHAW